MKGKRNIAKHEYLNIFKEEMKKFGSTQGIPLIKPAQRGFIYHHINDPDYGWKLGLQTRMVLGI